MIVCEISLSIFLLFLHTQHTRGTRHEKNWIPWPVPRNMTIQDGFMTIDRDFFSFSLEETDCPILKDAFDRYLKMTFLEGCEGRTKQRDMTMTVKMTPTIVPNDNSKPSPTGTRILEKLDVRLTGACEEWPHEDMEESYTLNINTPDAPSSGLLESSSVWGILRGLETFSQLVYRIAPGKFAVNSASIHDYPAYQHRGYLLDSSRHFLSLRKIKQHLDLMAMNKMNVFHWHIVDDQSFPFKSEVYPKLSEKGAYDPVDRVYTHDDIKDLLNYARQRGIRIVPEFDTPGHTMSWGLGYRDLLTKCHSEYFKSAKYGPIDPTKEENFKFMKNLFSEVASLFKDKYIHLGGDEVDKRCWQSNPRVRRFEMNNISNSDLSGIESYYINRLFQELQSLNKSYIVWQEVFENRDKIPKETTIQVWKSPYQSVMTGAVTAGYHVILSAPWYLDYVSASTDWEKYYKADLRLYHSENDSLDSLVLGGEACLWGEYVDGTNVVQKAWPRGSAVAERLWSNPKQLTDTTRTRHNIMRCLMFRRGYDVGPSPGPGFCQCDYLL